MREGGVVNLLLCHDCDEGYNFGAKKHIWDVINSSSGLDAIRF